MTEPLEESPVGAAAEGAELTHQSETAGPYPADLAPGGRDGAPRKRRAKTGKGVSGNPAKRDPKRIDAAVLTGFTSWLFDQAEIAAPSVEAEIQVFSQLLNLAREAGIDPHRPSGVLNLVEQICDTEEEAGSAQGVLATVDDYIHYRMRADGETEPWAEVHEVVQDALDEYDPLSELLGQVIEATDQIDPALRQAVHKQIRIVTMVPRLLEWLGPGRPAAPSGGVRRSDIAQVAGFLGIDAVGVNKRPPTEPDGPSLFEDESPERAGQVIHALSAAEVPPLAAWWLALRSVEVIEVRPGKVRPGPAASDWQDATVPAVEPAEQLIGAYVACAITNGLHGDAPYEDRVVELVMTRLLQAVAPEEGLVALEENTLDRVLDGRVRRALGYLAQMGLVELDAEGQASVAPELRGAMARGLMLVIMLLETAGLDLDDSLDG